MNDKVTVIIPTYKRANYLTRAIDSVLNQSYDNIEIIVVDDNNPDTEYRLQNEKIMEKYKENINVKYIKHLKNKNGSAARNTGIKEATGEYITFLDDDDFFLKNRIKKLVNALEENNEYDCAYSSLVYVKDGKIMQTKEANKKGNFLLDILAQNSFFGTGSNIFFRKKIIDKIGLFDEAFIRHQDMEYMARFFDYGKVINVNEILVVKCVDDTQNVPNFENMKKTKEMFLKKFEKSITKFKEEEKNIIYFNNYFELLTFTEFKSKEYKEIKSYLMKLKNIPFNLKRKIYIYEIKKRTKIVNIIIKIRNSKNIVIDCSKEKKDEIESYINQHRLEQNYED